MILHVSAGDYDVVIERGVLEDVGTLLNLDRKVLVVTNDGVPPAYAGRVCALCKEGFIHTVLQGEKSKSLQTLGALLQHMLDLGFTRKDCVVAVGGGVVGDLAGFAAAVYMRGVDFYNVPTTLLSQVDSSVGGKTAVNLGGVKNAVGAFYPPKKVLIDPDLLRSLDRRLLAEGMAESLKMAVTSDPTLFEIFERGEAYDRVDEVIERSVRIKRDVVEQDEKEAGLRRVLNLGHTLGHGIEAVRQDLFHGECVALGLPPMCSQVLRPRVEKALSLLGLPKTAKFDEKEALEAIRHDKKGSEDGGIVCVLAEDVGAFRFEKLSIDELKTRLQSVGRDGV